MRATAAHGILDTHRCLTGLSAAAAGPTGTLVSLTYVAGYDGSEAARAAVRLARSLAKPFGARVLVVNVYPPVPFVAGKAATEGARREVDAAARGEAERLLAELGEPGVEQRAIAAPSAAHGLQRVAEEEGASLLAVGAHHRGPFGRLLPGGVAERLLHGSPCPVAVVPAGDEQRLSTIAVAYDGGEEAQAALSAGHAVASRLGARLLLLAAIDPDAVPAIALLGAVTDIHERLRGPLERRLAEAADQLPPTLQVQTRVVPGVGAPAVVVACETEGVDLLFSGSRGYGPVRSVLLGSFSRHLVQHAPCPVVVVPRGAAMGLDGGLGEAVGAATRG